MMNLGLEEFLFYSRQAQTKEVLFSLYENALESHGFDQTAYAVISDHQELKNNNELGVVKNNSLNDWESHYLECNYAEIDPTPKYNHLSSGVLVWKDFVQRVALPSNQLKVFQEASEMGLNHGATLSVHGPGGTKSATIVSSSQQNVSFPPYALDLINLMTYQLHLCFLSLMDYQPDKIDVSLSQKEADVLKWVAKGMTKCEVADRLNISAHTVDYHVRSIMRKLGTKNTASALIAAIKKGLITI